MVRIEADVAVGALETRSFDPVGDHPHFCRAVAILARDLRVDPFIEPDDRSRPDHVIEAEPLCDFIGVETIGCGREDEAAPVGLVARNCLSRARPDVRCKLRLCKALNQGFKLAGMDLCSKELLVVDFLEPRAVDELEDISKHRKDHQRQEDEPPWRSSQRAVEKEGRVGRSAGDRPVHVIDCKIAHAFPPMMASTSS